MADQITLKKIRSGVETIDTRLGGFVAAKAYLVYGEPGTGKTVFSLQFLNEGLVQGETCALIAQENPEDVLTMGRHIGFHWGDHLACSRLIVLTYLPSFGPCFSKSFNLNEVFDELRTLSNGAGIARLVFDPITPFVDCVNRLNYSKVFTEFFALLDRLGSTTLLTLDEISGVSGPPFLRTLISLAFGAIHLRISPDLHRKMFFQKIKYQSELLQPATYTIQPRKGIVVLASEKQSPEVVGPRKKKILIGDQDRSVCQGIERILGDKYTLIFVHDGIEALTKIVNNPLDLIVLDATLPKIDGFDICKRIRSQGSCVPVFLISGDRRRISDKVNGFNLGADEYMLKPVNLLELESRVQAILQRGRDLKHWALPAGDTLGGDMSRPSAMGSPRTGAPACLSQDAFARRVDAEIESASSNLFTLVGCQLTGGDPGQEEELTHICAQVLASEVREDDFVGDLGSGRVCVCLRGAGGESSHTFIRRARKSISEAAKQRLERPCPSISMKTSSATFPMDGEDTDTLLDKVFGNESTKSPRPAQDLP